LLGIGVSGTDSAGLEVLDISECLDLLETVDVGRVAVTVGALPAIFPVNFRLVDGRIVFATGEGTKLAAALREAVVAFEVDWFDPASRAGWSVHVLGTARVCDSSSLERMYAEMAGLESWTPAARPYLVAIEAAMISGRRFPQTASVAAGSPDGV
jgi:nitroimidazol reductase NimA-like FMN-containing flavoprotein (pyridoxamine 5'-phosphate oxidase superfamily)